MLINNRINCVLFSTTAVYTAENKQTTALRINMNEQQKKIKFRKRSRPQKNICSMN